MAVTMPKSSMGERQWIIKRRRKKPAIKKGNQDLVRIGVRSTRKRDYRKLTPGMRGREDLEHRTRNKNRRRKRKRGVAISGMRNGGKLTDFQSSKNGVVGGSGTV